MNKKCDMLPVADSYLQPMKEAEYVNNALRKKYLLEFVYSEYKSEIDRKYLIENKVFGYYTILGISFAAFIASFLYIITNDFNFELTLNGYMSAFCVITGIFYLIFMIITIILLNKSYRPKDTLHHDVKNYWEKLQNDSDIIVYESLYENIIECLDFNRAENKKIVDYLKRIDFCMFHLIIFNILLTIKIFFNILVDMGGNR